VFDLINGLPVHPLVVHAAVVLIPLSMLGTVLIAVKRSWRKSLGWWVVALTAAATVSAWVAKESGEALAKRVGEPEVHASLGDTLPLIMVVMYVCTTALVVADRLTDRGDQAERKRSPLVVVLGVVAVVVALGATFQTYRVGDSGAVAVWAGQVSDSAAGAPPAPEPSSAGTPTATPSGKASANPTAEPYTMAEVKAHSAAGDCWVAIDGKVYDLTNWED
jgi:uncharacterized membrane protein